MCSTSSTSLSCLPSSHPLFPQKPTKNPQTIPHFPKPHKPISSSFRLSAKKPATANAPESQTLTKPEQADRAEAFEEVEEELPWIQEKALDLVEFTGSVTQAIPGPRVGQSSLPWILAVPLAYVGVSFVLAVFKSVKKLGSPAQQHKRMVSKNAGLCRSIDELFAKGRDKVQPLAINKLAEKTGFSVGEVLRKYIRYALNEKPFDPDLVSNLIQLRKATELEDYQVSVILNNIARRIVRDKGAVVMDMSGYSERGFQRKIAVHHLFGKLFYLSELPDFCSKNCSLVLKDIFGVTDEDVDKLRLHTLSYDGDVDSLEKMVQLSDSEDSDED